MPFKLKDLLVDVVSAAGALQCNPSYICRFGCSFHIYSGCHQFCTYVVQSYCHLGCTNFSPTFNCQAGSLPITLTCPGTKVIDTGEFIEVIPQLSGPALANLKGQLMQALEVAEKQSVAESEALQPQTLEEVALLETKMGEAMEALKARRAELSKQKQK